MNAQLTSFVEEQEALNNQDKEENIKVIVPPIKCQGIKTKIIPHINKVIKKPIKGKWIEPFLGSGVVLFNINTEKALINDINPHIIELYNQIKKGVINPENIKKFLEIEGDKLRSEGADYYYKVRERFNKDKNSFDFLFLNRSCFNGVMRFNGGGRFNVPFGHKPDRFRQAYITKIVNQVSKIQNAMKNKDWIFESKDWREIMKEAKDEDIVYLDPPYIGRHTDYFNSWSEKDAEDMYNECMKLKCPFIVSMWKKNKYRENEYVKKWKNCKMISIKHFYHVGSKENLRNSMEEVLILGNFKDSFFSK